MANLDFAQLDYNFWKFNDLKQAYLVCEKQIKNIKAELTEKTDLCETEVKNLKQLLRDLQNVRAVLTNNFFSQ